MEKRKMEITVRGQNYTLITDEPEEKVAALTDGLNTMLDGIMENSRISMNQALILAALDLAQEASRQRAAAEKLKAEIGDYLEDAERAMTERDQFKRENDKLREKLKTQNTAK